MELLPLLPWQLTLALALAIGLKIVLLLMIPNAVTKQPSSKT